MKNIFKILLFILLGSLSMKLNAQNKKFKRVIFTPERKYDAIGARVGYGVLIPHRESMVHLVTGHIPTMELFIENSGHKRVWNKFYQFPSSGFLFFYGSLASKDVLGNAIALDYYSNMHLIKRKKKDENYASRFLLDMRMGTGIGYLTKTFDPDVNNHNVAIGSHVNISIALSFDAKWRLKGNWQFNAGLTLRHFSNGSFTTPNLGLNIPYLNFGLKKHFGHPRIFPREYVILDSAATNNYKKLFSPYARINLIAGLGTKEIYPAGGNKYGVYSLQTNFNAYRHLKTSYSVGADIIHNVSLYKHAERHDSTWTGTQSDITQIGFTLGYSQTFDKFELFIQPSIYILSKYKKDGLFYQRLGGRYYIKENFIVQFALKTHFAKADYFECGVGYSFLKNKKTKIVDL